MRNLTIILLLALGAGCTTTPDLPDVPESTRVAVTTPAKIPAWAKEPLPLPKPADGTIAERVLSEEARGEVIVLANCHRRLLALLEEGKDVDPATCTDGVRPW